MGSSIVPLLPLKHKNSWTDCHRFSGVCPSTMLFLLNTRLLRYSLRYTSRALRTPPLAGGARENPRWAEFTHAKGVRPL